MHESKVGQSWLNEVIREAVKQVLEAVMETGRKAFLAERGGKRNGHHQRGLATRQGLLRLSVPRDQDGRFHAALFAPYQRRTGDLEALALAMYAAGVSTRKVGGYLSACTCTCGERPTVPAPSAVSAPKGLAVQSHHVVHTNPQP